MHCKGAAIVKITDTDGGIFWPDSVLNWTVATSTFMVRAPWFPNVERATVSVVCGWRFNLSARFFARNDRWEPLSKRIFASTQWPLAKMLLMAVFRRHVLLLVKCNIDVLGGTVTRYVPACVNPVLPVVCCWGGVAACVGLLRGDVLELLIKTWLHHCSLMWSKCLCGVIFGT